MSKQTPRHYRDRDGRWIKVEDYKADTAALKSEIARLRELVEQVLADHADPQSPFYNDCDAPTNLCDWCGQATKALEAAK